MRERPILFSGPMVSAIPDGRKTQTRRVVNPQPVVEADGRMHHKGIGWTMHHERLTGPKGVGTMVEACPYGQPGDRLWVRETWTADFDWPEESGHPRTLPWEQTPAAFRGPKNCTSVYYAADRIESHPPVNGVVWTPREDQPTEDEWEQVRWKPSIHMPRWASRLTLGILAVRVERLQDISEADVLAEGFSKLSKDGGRLWKFGLADRDGLPGNDDHGWHWKEWEVSARDAYRKLWVQLHGIASWDANPWVWVVEFKAVTP